MIKPIETMYKGQMFRSRLEARWAVFFDACGVEWEYEPQGFDLGNGLWYLPDFALHGVYGDVPSSDIYVEVKGEYRDGDDEKIIEFSMERPLLVLRDIPRGGSWIALLQDIRRKSLGKTYEFGATTLSDYITFDTAVPVIDKAGRFSIIFDDRSKRNIQGVDELKTERAYSKARNRRF